MAYGKSKKGKKSSYNGQAKSIMGKTEATKGPGFMSETGKKGDISKIAGHKSIGG